MRRVSVSRAITGLVRSLVTALGKPEQPASPARPDRALNEVAGDRDLTLAEIRALSLSYAPDPDGDPDPGEIVWAWVPYAEHDGRGKDRPVLILARVDAATTAGCYLSTKQHRGFVSVGTGRWDSQGRESFLATDRVLRLPDARVRREGHVLERGRFIDAAGAVMRAHGVDRRNGRSHSGSGAAAQRSAPDLPSAQ